MPRFFGCGTSIPCTVVDLGEDGEGNTGDCCCFDFLFLFPILVRRGSPGITEKRPELKIPSRRVTTTSPASITSIPAATAPNTSLHCLSGPETSSRATSDSNSDLI